MVWCRFHPTQVQMAAAFLTCYILAVIFALCPDDSPLCTHHCWFQVVLWLQTTGQGASLLSQSRLSIWLCWKPFTCKNQGKCNRAQCPARRDHSGFNSRKVHFFLSSRYLYLTFSNFFPLLPSYTSMDSTAFSAMKRSKEMSSVR